MKIIFGGAFNPIHKEHINMIKHLLKREDVEKVIILPSFNPPHKTCNTSFEQRSDMIKLSLEGFEGVEICDYENSSQCKHYSCEVLPVLKKMYGDIAFVIGGDSLEAFHTWKNPQEIIKICPLYVFSRGKSKAFAKAMEYWKSQGADIVLCDYQPKDISSTLVRYSAMIGDYRYVDSKVKDYIVTNKLFDKYSDIFNKLKNNISQKTFEHCTRTAFYALRLNYMLRLGLDYDKVLLAGMLHDCAKGKTVGENLIQGVPSDSVGSAVEHQFLGNVLAKQEYGIDDDEILDAIRYHTTGKYSMTKLQKLIFCSDMLEEARNFEGVSTLRRSITHSLDAGYKNCAMRQYNYLLSKGGDIYPLTLEAVKGLEK